jgi:hypothetical protein
MSRAGLGAALVNQMARMLEYEIERSLGWKIE